MTKPEETAAEVTLAELRAALKKERGLPDRNACHERAIERDIETLLARMRRSATKETT